MTPARSARVVPSPLPGAFLFEISWEVCHQVGGIYQVLRSKARAVRERWDDRYVLVGPRVPEMVAVEIESAPVEDWLSDVLKELESQGVGAQYGRWLVAGRPRVVLLDHHLPPERIEVLRHRMHRDYGIPPERGNELLDGVLAFGECVRLLLTASVARASDLRFLAHFHEWLGSAALAPVRRELPQIATIFTTHATSVGRYVASSGEDLYEHLRGLDAGREAARFGIDAQHAIERTSARETHVLTTVSPITGEECEHLLGRAPDLVTPNGLDLARFDVGQDIHTLHGQYKEHIHRFVMGHFFPSYHFDLDRTLYLFNSGRFEPRNKGFDLCLEAAARMNAELRAEDSDLTVVLFLVTARDNESLDASVLHARGVLDDLEEVAERIGHDVAQRLFRCSAAGETPTLDSLVDDYWRLRHRRLQHAFLRRSDPLLCTHVLRDPEQDPVMAHLRHLGLANREEDRVKIVYHPEFISSVNPVWGMDYEQFVRGCHLGIFPSCYEPWGYTPLECLAMCVPAITSDLAGFGRYATDAFPDHDEWGLQVLPRRERGYHDAAADLTQRLLAFCKLTRSQRSEIRSRVEARSHAFDWPRLVFAYHESHDRALGATKE